MAVVDYWIPITLAIFFGIIISILVYREQKSHNKRCHNLRRVFNTLAKNFNFEVKDKLTLFKTSISMKGMYRGHGILVQTCHPKTYMPERMEITIEHDKGLPFEIRISPQKTRNGSWGGMSFDERFKVYPKKKEINSILTDSIKKEINRFSGSVFSVTISPIYFVYTNSGWIENKELMRRLIEITCDIIEKIEVPDKLIK